jgi:hypothetical protein
MRKRGHHTRVASAETAKEILARILEDDDEGRTRLERVAKKLGVSVDTALDACLAIGTSKVTGEPVPAATVECLAKRGLMILGKRELN